MTRRMHTEIEYPAAPLLLRVDVEGVHLVLVPLVDQPEAELFTR